MTTTPTPEVARTTRDEIRAAAVILDYAARMDLPMPLSVHSFPTGGRGIELNLSTVADLAEWAKWLDVPIGEEEPRRYGHGAYVRHKAIGEAFEQPVVLTASQRIAVTAP